MLASCAGTVSPVVLTPPSGTLILARGGVFEAEGAGFRRLSPSDGLAPGGAEGLFPVNDSGEAWVTYGPSPAAGVTRLRPGPAQTLTPKDGLKDGRVSLVAGAGNIRAFAYAPQAGLGFSVASGTSWTHYAKANSPLRDNRITGLLADALGGIWARMYSPDAGCARLTDGRLVPYDTSNSGLPRNDILDILPEPPGRGTPGDQVWFVTVDGLTRFTLGDGTWKHFGRNPADITDFLRLLGVDTMFSSAILEIRSLAVDDTGLWIATPKRIYRFDGDAFTRIDASFTEGSDSLRFSAAAPAEGGVWAAVTNVDSKTVAEVARYRVGEGWNRYPLEGLRLKKPAEVRFFQVGGDIWALAPEWSAKVLVLRAAGEPVVRDLAGS